MPNCLAICCAESSVSVAMQTNTDQQQLIEQGGQRHARRILALLDELLLGCSVPKQQIDRLFFSAGPGSFTGVRVATSVAQAIGYANGIRVQPISNLAAIAVRFHSLHPEANGTLGVRMDARMDELFSANFRLAKGAVPERLTQDRLISAQAQALIVETTTEFLWGSALQTDETSTFCDPQALDLLSIGLSLPHADAVEPAMAMPTYLRNENAWKKIGAQ